MLEIVVPAGFLIAVQVRPVVVLQLRLYEYPLAYPLITWNSATLPVLLVRTEALPPSGRTVTEPVPPPPHGSSSGRQGSCWDCASTPPFCPTWAAIGAANRRNAKARTLERRTMPSSTIGSELRGRSP